VIARSNGLVVNAQIIESSRGLSQLWPDISIHLRTNRVSSLSNRPPNRRASLKITCSALSRKIVGTRSEDAKEIAFWRFCRLTRACVPLSCLTGQGLERPACIAATLGCCWPTIVSAACSPHTTPARTHIQTNTRRRAQVERARLLLAAVAGILHAHHIQYTAMPCHAICNMQMQYPAKRNGPTAAGCR
jgi:hypothetical protein